MFIQFFQQQLEGLTDLSKTTPIKGEELLDKPLKEITLDDVSSVLMLRQEAYTMTNRALSNWPFPRSGAEAITAMGKMGNLYKRYISRSSIVDYI